MGGLNNSCKASIHKFNTMQFKKPEPRVKQFLQAIEASGSSLNNVTVEQLADSDPAFFGENGSHKRRELVVALDNLKRKKSIAKYMEILEMNGVTPSTATQNSYDAAQSATVEELDEVMSQVTIENNGKTKRKKAPSVATPPRGKHGLASFGSPSFQQPTQGTAFSSSILDDEDEDDEMKYKGFLPSDPHKIFITGSECILPHGFVSAYYNDADLKDCDRPVFMLFKTVGGDSLSYVARLPDDDEFPQYAGRCILLEAPTIDYVFDDIDIPIESIMKTPKPKNKNTGKEEETFPQAILSAIKKGLRRLTNHRTLNPEYAKQYYLFVYPHGIQFDNIPLSGEGSNGYIKTHTFRTDDKFGVFRKNKHFTVINFWAIALVADETNRNKETTTKASIDHLDL